MCGRFSLTMPVQEVLGMMEPVDIAPRFNIAPTQDVLIYRVDHEGRKQLAPVRWGLIPAWADTLPTGAPLINARCETVASKPSFRGAFRSRRCIIPATGFYEWLRHVSCMCDCLAEPSGQTCRPIGSTLRGRATRQQVV